MKTKEEKILILATELEKLSRCFVADEDLDELEWKESRVKELRDEICRLTITERTAGEFLISRGYKL